MNSNSSISAPDDGELTALMIRFEESEAALKAYLARFSVNARGSAGSALLFQRAQQQAVEMQACILDALPAQVALVNGAGLILAVNHAWRQFAVANDYQGPEFAIGMNYLEACERATGTDSEGATAAATGIRQVLDGELGTFTLDYPCHSPDGPQWFRLNVTPLSESALTGAVIMHSNITVGKLMEIRLQRLNRLHSVLSKTSDVIVLIRDRQELYDAVCRIMVKNGQVLHAWIAELNAAGDNVHAVASSGAGHAMLRELQINFDDGPFSKGPLGTSLRTGVHDYCNNIESDPRMIPWRLLAKQHEFRANASFPIKVGGNVISALVIAVEEEGYFQADEIDLLKSVAEGISFALESAHLDGQRLMAEQALRASEQLFANAFERAPIGIALVSPAGDFIRVNRSLCNMVGHAATDLLGTGFQDMIHPDDRQTGVAELLELLDGEENSYQMEKRCLHREGGEVWASMSVSLVRDDGGAPLHLIAQIQDIHEKKRAELEIRRTSELLRAVTEGTPDAVFVKDLDGRYQLFNKAAARFVGRSVDEVIGKMDSAIFSRQDTELLQKRMREVIESGEPVTSEDVITSAGVRRTFLAMKAPYRDGAGEIVGIIGISRDISDYKRAQESARASEERFRSASLHLKNILDSSLDVICSFDAAGRFLQVNAPCEALFGYTPEELLGTCYIEKVLAEDVARTHQEAAAVMAGRVTRSFENRIVRKDGRVTHVQWSARWSDVERTTYCVARDMSETRKDAARILEQASLLDKATDAIFVRDLDNRITYWNKSAERLYGWTAEEVLGQSVFLLLHREEDAEAYMQASKSLLTTGEFSGEWYKVDKEGKQLAIAARWTLVCDDRLQPKSILSINTDITERRNLERQFLRAQRMESIGTLAGGIAHDLNNVLAPIMMSIDLLKMRENDPMRLSILSTIESSAKRGAEMVRQVLTFARGMEGLQLEVRVPALLKEIEKIANETFLKNIQVNGLIPDGLWTVQGDVTQLHQVLLNLCVNARDAMPDGGTLTLSARNLVLDEQYAGMDVEAKLGPHVVIQVEDNGDGMAPQVIDRIFEPFFTTKEPGKGTGLGLSTSLAIVKSHGGFVRVYSKPGQGTKFQVYLPALPAAAPEEEILMPPVMPHGNGELILIVDDEAPVREITRQTLESFGYQVMVAEDGVEAVAIYAREKNRIAVVLTDMMMPLMDGPAAIRVLLNLNPQVRIIAVSGLDSNKRIVGSGTSGVRHFLSKPFNAEALLNALKIVLSEESHPPESHE